MTIKDLARETGYSVGTISRVLNNQPNVSEKARKTILACVEKSGFQLNTNAKHLKLQNSAAIAVLVKGTQNMLFADLLERGELFMQADETTWICLNCGHIHYGEKAPEVCPVCAHPKAYFELLKTNY